MSDVKEAPEAAAGEGGDVKKAAKKKMFIIIGVVVLLAIIGAGVFFSGILGGKKEEKPAEHAEGEAPKEDEHAKKPDEGGKPAETNLDNKKLYLNIGEFLVNLNVSGKQASFLKMTTTLEVVGEVNKKAVEDNLPRIKDAFQTYLRELRAEDLNGSAGVFRLREGLLLRVNKVLAPAQVSDILFEELIVQ